MFFAITTGPDPVGVDEVTHTLLEAFDALSPELKSDEHRDMAEDAAICATNLVKACGPGPFTVTIDGQAETGHTGAPTTLTVSVTAASA